MRRVTWLVLVGAVCVGCGKKEDVALPNVTLEADGQQVTVPLRIAQPPTFELAYGKMWDPKNAERTDPAAAVKTLVAQRYFANHHTEFLAPATVGSCVCLAQGGLHGVAVPVALASAYPDVAQKFEAKWKEGIKITAANVSGTPLLDASTTGGPVSTRVLVIRVKDGTDDELRVRFGEYLARLEEAVKVTGTTITAHQRGGIRITGALSDIRYEGPGHSGFVRSVVVRKFDEADPELTGMLVGDTGKGQTAELVKASLNPQNGPFLVVALRNERR